MNKLMLDLSLLSVICFLVITIARLKRRVTPRLAGYCHHAEGEISMLLTPANY